LQEVRTLEREGESTVMKLPVGVHDINKYIKIRKEIIKTVDISGASDSAAQQEIA
jgi:hypothetical protein